MVEKQNKNEKGIDNQTNKQDDKINQIKIEDNIIHKIWAIQSEVKDLVRDEKVQIKSGYNFYDELQVLRILRPLLKKHRLVISISDDPNSDLNFQQFGSNQWLVKFLKVMTVTNVKSGDDINTKDVINMVDGQGGMTYKIADESRTFSFWAIGTNTDPAKAKGAADTYGVKYALSKFFLIPVKDEVDPDRNQTPVNSEQKKINNVVALNEKTQKLYDLFIEVRGNSKEKQTQLLFELDKITVGIDKYKIDTSTSVSNFRDRLNLLDDEDYKKYWDFLEGLKKTQ